MGRNEKLVASNILRISTRLQATKVGFLCLPSPFSERTHRVENTVHVAKES